MRTLALVGATLSLVSLLVSPGFAQQVSSLTAAERAGIALARRGFFVGFLMGGVAGGVTGGLVGAAFPTWQRRVP